MNESPHASTVTGYLSDDHKRLDGVMEQIRARAAAGDMKEAASLFAGFQERLNRHIRIEEDLLFPEFERATGMSEGGPTGVMRHEHLAIRDFMSRIGALLEGPHPSPGEFETLRASLFAILHEHNVKEEQILYPMTDKMVPPHRRAELVSKLKEA